MSEAEVKLAVNEASYTQDYQKNVIIMTNNHNPNATRKLPLTASSLLLFHMSELIVRGT